MSKLLIKGKTVISVTHRISGNKNAALPMIAAALLTVATMYPYLKHRIPEIREENAISGTDAQHASVGRARGDKTRGGR